MKFPALFLGLLFWSCSPTDGTKEKDREALNRQLNEIKSLIAEGSCDENHSCQAIGVGSKACGGPKVYLVYSSSIDVEILEEKVARFNQAEAQYNEKYQITSDCSLVSAPENIDCKDGNCVIIE